MAKKKNVKHIEGGNLPGGKRMSSPEATSRAAMAGIGGGSLVTGIGHSGTYTYNQEMKDHASYVMRLSKRHDKKYGGTGDSRKRQGWLDISVNKPGKYGIDY